jgi:erythromycin esterase
MAYGSEAAHPPSHSALSPTGTAPDKTDSGPATFLKWARESLAPLATLTPESHRDDLAPLGRMIGNATVVALSEGVHGSAEPLEFRNRVLQYLVEQKGFTAIVIEAGSVESRKVHDYVRVGAGDLATVVAEGFSWTFDELPQNRALVLWLKEYNADPRHPRKVNFYGFDVPGSPGNPSANRGLESALTEALQYLARVDSTATAAFHTRLDSLLTNLRFDLRRPADAPGYDRLSATERDALTAAIADLIALLERREAHYMESSSVSDYEWAYRAAVGARQADEWLRQVPLGWRPVSGQLKFPSEEVKFLSAATDVRDRAQADNLDWIVRQEGPLGKILIYAHRYHLSTTPVKASWWLPDGAAEHPQAVTGTYLRRRFGKQLLTIGNLIGKGEVNCAGFKCCAGPAQILPPASSESIDGLAGELEVPRFLLDLRAAPVSVAHWLDQEHELGQGHDVLKLAVGRAFDVLFYLDSVSPACGATRSGS